MNTFVNKKNDMQTIQTRNVKQVPVIMQSIQSLFALSGKHVPIQALLSALSGSAPSPATCVRAVKSLGAECRIVNREDIEAISSMVLPCVILTKSQKSFVLVSYDENEATVILPENGEETTKMTRAELENEYSGYAIFSVISPEKETKQEHVVREFTNHWFFDVLKQYKTLYRSVFLGSFFINLLALMGPLFMMNVYDRVIPNMAVETLWVLAVGIFVGYLFEIGLRILRASFTNRVSRNMDIVLTSRIMNKILGLDITQNPYTSGGLMQCFRELDSLREFFSASTILALVDFPFLIIFLVILYLIGGPIVIIPLIAIILLLSYIFWAQKKLQAQATEQQEGEREKSNLLVEMITGSDVIRTSSAEPRMMRTWEKISSYTAEQSEKSKRTHVNTNNISLLLTHISSVALIIFGVYLIADKYMTMGALIASNMLCARAMSFVVQLAALLPRWQSTKNALADLNNLMSLPDEVKEESVDTAGLSYSLDLKKLNFTFEGAIRPTLSNINLYIAPGEKVGIIGNMGSGKSTLSRVIVGLLNPNSGKIKFGDVNMNQIDKKEMRSRIGYVPQETMLFQGTVRENICLGIPFVNDKLLLRAAWLAGVSDFIQNHPAGYSMPVMERGSNLSGGQRQAISLARALLSDPDILILDEPTSNMDGTTEASVIQRLKPHLKNKTLLINMHRMSLMQLVDRVIVLKDGAIIADGPKDAILEKVKLAD